MLPQSYLTGLEQNRYSAGYVSRLSAGLDAFRLWLSATAPPGWQLTRRRHKQLDHALAMWADSAHNKGVGFELVKHGILAPYTAISRRV